MEMQGQLMAVPPDVGSGFCSLPHGVVTDSVMTSPAYRYLCEATLQTLTKTRDRNVGNGGQDNAAAMGGLLSGSKTSLSKLVAQMPLPVSPLAEIPVEHPPHAQFESDDDEDTEATTVPMCNQMPPLTDMFSMANAQDSSSPSSSYSIQKDVSYLQATEEPRRLRGILSAPSRHGGSASAAATAQEAAIADVTHVSGVMFSNFEESHSFDSMLEEGLPEMKNTRSISLGSSRYTVSTTTPVNMQFAERDGSFMSAVFSTETWDELQLDASLEASPHHAPLHAKQQLNGLHNFPMAGEGLSLQMPGHGTRFQTQSGCDRPVSGPFLRGAGFEPSRDLQGYQPARDTPSLPWGGDRSKFQQQPNGAGTGFQPALDGLGLPLAGDRRSFQSAGDRSSFNSAGEGQSSHLTRDGFHFTPAGDRRSLKPGGDSSSYQLGNGRLSFNSDCDRHSFHSAVDRASFLSTGDMNLLQPPPGLSRAEEPQCHPDPIPKAMAQPRALRSLSNAAANFNLTLAATPLPGCANFGSPAAVGGSANSSFEDEMAESRALRSLTNPVAHYWAAAAAPAPAADHSGPYATRAASFPSYNQPQRLGNIPEEQRTHEFPGWKDLASLNLAVRAPTAQASATSQYAPASFSSFNSGADGRFSFSSLGEQEEEAAQQSGSQTAGQAQMQPMTTLMVRNVPEAYSSQMLYEEWPNNGTYDFLYLPYDTALKQNRSYAFVNFTSEAAANAFFDAWQHRHLASFSPEKPLDICWAKVQGLEANLRQLVKKRVGRMKTPQSQPMTFKNGVPCKTLAEALQA